MPYKVLINKRILHLKHIFFRIVKKIKGIRYYNIE